MANKYESESKAAQARTQSELASKPTCRKGTFSSEAAAIKRIEHRRRDALRHGRTEPNLRAYHCPLCGSWHLTSTEKRR